MRELIQDQCQHHLISYRTLEYKKLGFFDVGTVRYRKDGYSTLPTNIANRKKTRFKGHRRGVIICGEDKNKREQRFLYFQLQKTAEPILHRPSSSLI